MVIRAGVDDRDMTSALGINIQVTFAIAFMIGSALAAFGGVVFASQAQSRLRPGRHLAPELPRGRDHRRHGVAGRGGGGLAPLRPRLQLLVRLPARPRRTQYSIVFTFILLALVLAFRPQGLFGRAG